MVKISCETWVWQILHFCTRTFRSAECFLTENKVEYDFCEFFFKEPVENWLLRSLYYHPQSMNQRNIQKEDPKRKVIWTWKVE